MAHASQLARVAGAFEGGPDLQSQAVAVLRACTAPSVLESYGVSDPADLPVGAGDRALLDAYVRLSGRPLETHASCRECGALTTVSLDGTTVGSHRWTTVVLGRGAGLREPTYADLLSSRGDPGALLLSCRVGPAAAPDAGPPDLDSVDMSLAGPLHSACVECGAAMSIDVDVVVAVLQGLAVLCAEVDREVHVLATAYGWDLATIESLPDPRRRRLADLVSGVAG